LTAGEEAPIPEEFYSEALLDYFFKRYEDMKPTQHWLYELTQGPPGD
jgi:hypothetical protein